MAINLCCYLTFFHLQVWYTKNVYTLGGIPYTYPRPQCLFMGNPLYERMEYRQRARTECILIVLSHVVNIIKLSHMYNDCYNDGDTKYIRKKKTAKFNITRNYNEL